MHADQGLPHRRHPGHQLFELQIAHLTDRRLGEYLAEIRHKPRIGVGREVMGR